MIIKKILSFAASIISFFILQLYYIANSSSEVMLVPRINTVEGLTNEHIIKWRWVVNEKKWINFPDYQYRIWKNVDSIRWKFKVLEVLSGYKSFVALPANELFCLLHPKKIEKQIKQNDYKNVGIKYNNINQGIIDGKLSIKDGVNLDKARKLEEKGVLLDLGFTSNVNNLVNIIDKTNKFNSMYGKGTYAFNYMSEYQTKPTYGNAFALLQQISGNTGTASELARLKNAPPAVKLALSKAIMGATQIYSDGFHKNTIGDFDPKTTVQVYPPEKLYKEGEVFGGLTKVKKVLGMSTGFEKLDKLTSGWQSSDLIIIAARPGMGKTALTLSMARKISVTKGIPVAFFSLEMSSVQLITRLISAETGLSSEKLRTGKLIDHEWEQLNIKVTDLEKAPLFIDDTPSLSIFDLRAKARRLASQNGIKLIIVDYLQLMTSGANSKAGNREQEISIISRNLKSLAKELDIPVIA